MSTLTALLNTLFWLLFMCQLIPIVNIGGTDMHTYSNTLGNRIRKLRNDISISQEELALKAGIAPSFLGEIERNTKKPSIDSIEKIATALEISLSELFNYNFDTLNSSDNLYLDKILIEVKSCTLLEQEALYRILKQAIALKNIRE